MTDSTDRKDLPRFISNRMGVNNPKGEMPQPCDEAVDWLLEGSDLENAEIVDMDSPSKTEKDESKRFSRADIDIWSR